MELQYEYQVNESELPASWVCKELSEQQRQQLCDLVAAHGQDPALTASIGYDLVDLPLLRLRLYSHDERGSIVARGGAPVLHTVEVALRTPLPYWWRPWL